MNRPFTAFNFKVELILDGQSRPLCQMAFAECSGLEMTMTPKTVQEGGNNAEEIHLIGPVSYGRLVLRRGMTTTYDLWDWFGQVASGSYHLRAAGVVVMMDSTATREQARFVLTRCLPVRIKAPDLNAGDGAVAIEELELAYERMRIERPHDVSATGRGPGVSTGVKLGASAALEPRAGVRVRF